MNERSVQTEDLIEDELDWDLSDHTDRETQTLPPNATHFQRNRVEAIVQTDYRYFPLALKTNGFLDNETNIEPKEMVDASTQTEQTKSSVSTQTDDFLFSRKNSVPELQINSGAFPRRSSDQSLISKDENEEMNSVTKMSSDLESLESQNVIPFVTSPLIPNNIVNLDFENPQNSSSAADSPSESSYKPDKRDAIELWRRLAPFAFDDFMPSFKMANKAFKRIKRMVDVSIQTENDLTEDEGEFAPLPPPCGKTSLLQNVNLSEIDLHVLTTPVKVTTDPHKLVKYLCKETTNDLHRARMIFRWIADNIRFDWKYLEKNQTVEEILESQGGVVKDYIKIFSELSFIAGLRTKTIHGFAKGFDYKVGRYFEPGKYSLHSWIAIFIFDSWRLIDPTWGAGYLDEYGRFHPGLEEHFFLTDPKDFIFTHFPWNEETDSYERWQLLSEPLPLEEFNLLPKVMPQFFACNLRFRRPKFSPVVFSQQTELQVASSMLLRYKFNLFLADETEDRALNEWVFCQLKEGGVVGSFTIIAPFSGLFHLKVYARSDETPEDQDEEAQVPHVFTFVIECTKSRKYPIPWPLHDGAWGPTPRLYECGLDPVNQPGPIIYTWGGRKILYFEKVSDVLLMLQVFDSEGVLLEPKTIMKKEEADDQIRISIVPPAIGFFKLLIYGIPRPQVKGRWKLPLLASYLVDCKMSLSIPVEKKQKRPSRQIRKE